MAGNQRFVHNEMPPIDDPSIMEASAALGRVRSAIIASLPLLVQQGGGLQSGPMASIVVGALWRMADTSLSIELLVSKGRWRDASTLLLTLVELRLDLQYIAAQPSRAGKWLDHQDQGRKPWRVATQIRSLFPEGGERDAELANYRTFSTIKHGNPAVGGLAFPVHPGVSTLTIPGDGLARTISLTCLAYAGLCLMAATQAADDGLRSVGQSLRDALDAAMPHSVVLEQVHLQHLTAIMKDLLSKPTHGSDLG